LLRPDYYYDSVFQIPYDRLYAHGIRVLVYDIDNTLATHADDHPPEETLALVEQLKEMGFKVALLSNNTPNRLNIFNKSMNLPGASMAAKPFTPGLRRVMEEIGATREETIIIGDQLFADVWCGKKAGIGTILVKPITDKEWWTVRLKRGLERRVLKRYLSTHVNQI